MTTDPFVAQLADLCRSEPRRAKWVFVPKHAVGLTLADRVAREGCGFANLRFVTPLDIAVRMAAPFLLDRGIDPSEEQLGPALMMRLLLELPEAGGYFRPMAEHTSMADALWRTVRELRYAGVRANELARENFTESAAKKRELVALLSAYERYLEANHIADMPMVLDEARRHADWCPIADGDIVTELPDALWSPLVGQFLASLNGQRVAARTIALPEVTIPERVRANAQRAAKIIERGEIETTTDATRLRCLQALEQASVTSTSFCAATPSTAEATVDGTLHIFHAGGSEAEIEEVFRRMQAAKLPLDQVEVACASQAYWLLVREKAARVGWPATIGDGVPAMMTRPGRLLLRFCDWIASDFAAADLRALFQAGDCGGQIGKAEGGNAGGGEGEGGTAGGGKAGDTQAEDDAEVSPGQAARLLLKAQATCGRATYAAALTRLAEKYERRAKDVELSDDERAWNARKGRQTRRLAAWLEAVLSAVPEPDDDGAVDLVAIVESAQSFLENNAGRASAMDAVAFVALKESLDDLRALGKYRCDLPDALRFLRERARSLTVGRDRPRPGHLHVSSLAEAGYDGRRLVFIVGLQEGGVFPSAVEDPVLLDLERKAIDRLLRTSTDRQDEAVFAALSRIAAVGASAERVCLSFSCHDTREFRETFPSWVVLQAFRLKKGDRTLTYDDLKKWLGEPASAVPPVAAQAIGEAGWWLAQVKTTAAARDAILQAYPLLERGLHAEAQRASSTFTEFDGLVEVAGPVLDPSRTGRPVSATTLESAAKCPLRFFMQHGLGVRVIEEGRADDDRWLDGATKGTELHELFARIMRHVRAGKRRPNLKIDRERLRGWGRERLDELRAAMPPPSEEVFARESREFLEDLDAFIDAECAGEHGTDPIGFEVTFGFPLDDEDEGEEPLASAEPAVIDLGDKRRLVLHGRIDRINRVKSGEYEVIDYKTGGYWADDWKGQFAGGTRLQHALYGVAAASLLKTKDPKARVVRGIYVFPAVKGHGLKKRIEAPPRAMLVDLLRDLLDVVGHGAFAPADLEGACKWCEFTAACHATDVSRAKSKRENAGNAVLEPYRRLRREYD